MDRIERIAGEMRRVMSDIIRDELKDPRIPLVTSITNIKLARDLKYAKVYVSVFGSEADKAEALAAFKSSAGFIRRKVGDSMTIRYVPELTFIIDESIEHGAYMSQLINEVNAKDEEIASRKEKQE